MHLLRTVRYYSFLILTLIIPLVYLILIKQGMHTITDTWQAFNVLCVASGATFLNYLFLHDRFASSFLILIGSSGLILAATYCFRQIYSARRLGAQLKAEKYSIVSSQKNTITLINDNRPLALTVGFFAPQIYLSSRLKQILSEEEFTCVLAHEQHHRSNRDALLSLALETLARLLFFLPLFRSFVKHMHLRHELAADQAALQTTSSEVLASAILKNIEYRDAVMPQQGTALGFSTISERVEFLINPSLKPAFRPSWLSLAWSVTVFFVVLLAATSLKPNDVHAQIKSAQGPMSKATTEHCKAEGLTFSSLSQSLQSEINMSVLFRS